MTIQEQVRAAAQDLQAGQTVRVVCPFCDARDEKSFAITRDYEKPWQLLFMCHRAKCNGSAGFLEDRAGVPMVLSKWDNQPPDFKPLTEHVQATDEFLEDFVVNKYGIGLGYLRRQGVEMEEWGRTLCMPWMNETGKQVGWVEKRFAADDVDIYKSHNDRTDGSYQGQLSFPRTNIAYSGAKRRDGTCVLVEGMLDSYRLGEQCEQEALPIYPVSLQGAQISKGDAFKVASLFDKVVVLLDPNMWPKGSVRVARGFRVFPTTVRLMTLDTDPKDAANDEINELLATIMRDATWNT